MKAFLKKIKAPIPVLCYSLCFLIWLFSSLMALAGDVIAKQTGSMYQFSLKAEDFQLVDMHSQPDGSYVNESGDPQMIWQNRDGASLRTLRMEAQFEGSPREMCLYYTSQPDEPFGVNKRVFAAQQNDGSYLYTLPGGKIAALRLDPCSPDGDKKVEMRFGEFSVNENVPLWKYFAPGWARFVSMIIVTGLAASAIRIAHDGWMWYKSKRNKTGNKKRNKNAG